jgi:hypothetical protein
MHYLLASIIGSGLSAIFSMAANFKWIWGKEPSALPGREDPAKKGPPGSTRSGDDIVCQAKGT